MDLGVEFYILLDPVSDTHYTIDLVEISDFSGSVKGYDSEGPFSCTASSAALKTNPVDAAVIIIGDSSTGETRSVVIPPIAVDMALTGSPNCSGTYVHLSTATLSFIKGMGGARISTAGGGGLLAEKWQYQYVVPNTNARYRYHWELFAGFKE